MNIYTAIYNYCTSTRTLSPHEQVGMGASRSSLPFLFSLPLDAELTVEVARTAGANLMGSDLYRKLNEYFIAHLKSLHSVRSHSFLLETDPE